MLSATEFWGDVAKEAGLTDEQVKALVATAADEKLLTALEKRGMRQSDYSRKLDEVRGLETRNNEWYTKEVAASAERQKAVDSYNARVQRYEQMYGPLDGEGGQPRNIVDTSVVDGINKKIETLQNTLTQVNTNAVSVIKDAMWISGDYYKRFGEVLDPNELEKYAVENKLPLKMAYERFIDPKLQEITKQQREKEKKEAYEQGVKDTASKHHLPTPESAARESHPFFDSYRTNKAAEKDSGQKTGRQLREGFAQAWEEAAVAPAK